jgi:hypothetical protein
MVLLSNAMLPQAEAVCSLSILYDFYGFEYGLRRSGNDDDILIGIHKNRLQKIGPESSEIYKKLIFSLCLFTFSSGSFLED